MNLQLVKSVKYFRPFSFYYVCTNNDKNIQGHQAQGLLSEVSKGKTCKNTTPTDILPSLHYQFHGKIEIKTIIFYLHEYLFMFTNIGTRMLTGILFVITQTVEIAKYLPRGGYLNKLWYIHSTEYYKVTKTTDMSIYILSAKTEKKVKNSEYNLF